MNRSLIYALVMTSVLAELAGMELPVAKVTLRLRDEDGKKLDNLDASVTFLNPAHKPGAWGSSDNFGRSGKTDSNGVFTAEERAGFEVAYGGGGAGFYRTRGRFDFLTARDGKYLPWNPTLDVTVKRILNPIPMFARRVVRELPVVDAPIGFDLEEADWVAPYGRGKISDFVFKLTKRVASFHAFSADLSLNFSNPSDGIQTMAVSQGSELRSPYNAPESGYGQSLSLLQGNSKEQGEYGMKTNSEDYVFRVRSATATNGQILGGLYGKIYRGIEYFPVSYKTAKLRFTYYLNPTLDDRNIEFDPKQNLFKNLKPDEQVKEP